MNMTLEQVLIEAYKAGFIEAAKWPSVCTQDADSRAVGDAARQWAEAHLALQSEGVSDEDVQIAFNAMDDHFTKSTPYRGQISDEDKAIAMEAMRAALTCVWHNRPAQEKATNYVSGRVDSTGKFHATAQEKAEPVSLAGSMVAMRDSVGSLCDKLQDRIKEVGAPPAERVRVPDDAVIVGSVIDEDSYGLIANFPTKFPFAGTLWLSAAPEADHG